MPIPATNHLARQRITGCDATGHSLHHTKSWIYHIKPPSWAGMDTKRLNKPKISYLLSHCFHAWQGHFGSHTHSSHRSFFASQKWGLPYQLHSSAQKGPKSASIYLKSWLSHCRRCILNLDTIRNVLLALKKKFGLPYQTPRKCPKGHHKTSMTLKFKLWHCHCCIHNFRNHTKMYTCITARVVFTISGSTRVPKRGPKVPQRCLNLSKILVIALPRMHT